MLKQKKTQKLMQNMENLKGDWNASNYFRSLTNQNKLAIANSFEFFSVDALEGFHSILSSMQSKKAFVCVSEVSQGYIDVYNTPKTRRIKTIFLAMRHKIDDSLARENRFDVMRELFRQFMSHLLREKTKLLENNIYIDSRISFREIDKYFFTGCACAYFQIAVDNQTSLVYEPSEWETTR